MLPTSFHDLKEWLHLSTFLTYTQEDLGTGKDRQYTNISKHQWAKGMYFPKTITEETEAMGKWFLQGHRVSLMKGNILAYQPTCLE